MPQHFTGVGGRIPWVTPDNTEQLIDDREKFFSDPDIIAAYEKAGIDMPPEEQISAVPDTDAAFPPYTKEQREEERLVQVRALAEDRRARDHKMEIDQDEEMDIDPDESEEEIDPAELKLRSTAHLPACVHAAKNMR
ncbi:MAG: hypothetical protein JWQ38_2106 [Flavipsychrobacter sp.]|nr:hypothetical protein [Flavipsychrobacter sp.]